jgi:ribosomal protein L37AE/L43A
MKCRACKTQMVKILTIGEYKCQKCTRCLVCGKRPAVINQTYGVLPCSHCSRAVDGKPLKGFRLTEKTLEYFATPFWKHMGLKAKPEEGKMEREMKRRGLTYLDLQRRRNLNAPYSNKAIVDKLERGELHGKPDPTYHRQ